MASRVHPRGFTLIEVLVALVIIAMGTLAIAGQIGQAARNARLMQVKTLGSWIALNKVAELRLIEGVPNAKKDSGEIEYAGREWAWTSEIKKPPGDVDNFMRVDVTVALADDPEYIVADAVGFIGRGGNGANARPFDVHLPDANDANDGRDVGVVPRQPNPGGGLTPRGEGT